MSHYSIVVIGASAGGVEALREVVKGLPKDFPAAIFVVLHLSPLGKSALPSVLSRAGAIPAIHPTDYCPIRPGVIYVAPPDYQMVVKHGYIRLTRGAKENGHRPAVDPLFRTAAAAYGPSVIGVILSGTRDDGAAGLVDIKAAGGTAIVQDPEDAVYSGMPLNAIEAADVDHILPLNSISSMLQHLAQRSIEAGEPNVPARETTDAAELEGEQLRDYHPSGVPSSYSCPDCGGVLWEVESNGLLRFRCRVGHAWAPDGLLEEQAESLEEALWVALRALEDHAALATRVAAGAHSRSRNTVAARFEREAANIQRRAGIIRRLLAQGITGETSRKEKDPEAGENDLLGPDTHSNN